MPRDSRTYITLHDGMPEHPKVEVLTDKAFRALVDLWCWCSRNRTDGKVREAVWVKRVPAKIRTELAASGMVENAADGVVMHDYLEHQRSAAEIDELSEKRRAAGSKGGSKAQAQKRASARASASANGKQAASKVEADTETEENLSSGTDERADVEALCQRLADRIEANGSKRPTITQRWRDECRRMLDLDGRDADKTARLVDWCQADPFWRSNVLSMPTFREKYDQLRLRANAEWEARKGSGMSIDGDVDPETVLGPDSWTIPDPPDGVEPGTPDYTRWARQVRDDHKAERVAQARDRLERRAG